jgi:hypothetical protein
VKRFPIVVFDDASEVVLVDLPPDDLASAPEMKARCTFPVRPSAPSSTFSAKAI